MFCSKCGKEIDDTSTFCNYCGNPVNAAAPAAPQPTPAQNSAPQYSAPQNAAPQFNAGFTINLAPHVIEMINKILRGGLAVVGLLALIGSIGTMGSMASLMSNPFSIYTSGIALYNFMVLLRVACIITFVLTVGGAVFTALTKQRSLFSYISGCIGLLMFIFHFIMFGMVGAALVGGVIVFAIFQILLSAALIAASVIILLKKEDIIKFKPKF